MILGLIPLSFIRSLLLTLGPFTSLLKRKGCQPMESGEKSEGDA